jgi:outer membrane protein
MEPFVSGLVNEWEIKSVINKNPSWREEMKVGGKRFRRVIGILLFIMIGGLINGMVYPAELKIGTVDIQKAVNECNEGKEDKITLTKEVEKTQHLIAERQMELQGMKESLEKQGLLMNAEARTMKENELQTKLREFQRWGEDIQNEINQKRMNMEKNLSLGLQKVIQKMAAEEGYTLILEKNDNIVLFNSMSIDITEQVIKAYNAQKK